MSILYEILVATAFSLLLSPCEPGGQLPKNDPVQQVSFSVNEGENGLTDFDCTGENPEL